MLKKLKITIIIKIIKETKKPVVSILKVDQETNKPLAGAVLAIKDSNGTGLFMNQKIPIGEDFEYLSFLGNDLENVCRHNFSPLRILLDSASFIINPSARKFHRCFAKVW